METIHFPMTPSAFQHALRLPLSAIVGMTQLLNQETLSLTQQEYVQAIQQAADQIAMLVKDLEINLVSTSGQSFPLKQK